MPRGQAHAATRLRGDTVRGERRYLVPMGTPARTVPSTGPPTVPCTHASTTATWSCTTSSPISRRSSVWAVAGSGPAGCSSPREHRGPPPPRHFAGGRCCRWGWSPLALSGRRTRRTFREAAVPTYSPKTAEIERAWHVVDAEGMVLGRLSTEVARILRGKHKTTFAPHVDTGDHVIIINADKVVLTSDKAEKKMVYRHSGYPGGIKARTYADLLVRQAGRGRSLHRARHASQDPPRPGPAQEAEGLRRTQPPPRSPAAHAAGVRTRSSACLRLRTS